MSSTFLGPERPGPKPRQNHRKTEATRATRTKRGEPKNGAGKRPESNRTGPSRRPRRSRQRPRRRPRRSRQADSARPERALMNLSAAPRDSGHPQQDQAHLVGGLRAAWASLGGSERRAARLRAPSARPGASCRRSPRDLSVSWRRERRSARLRAVGVCMYLYGLRRYVCTCRYLYGLR